MASNPVRQTASAATAAGGRTRPYCTSDIVLIGVGALLAVGCALLPAYIFFNQEQFGIRALTFEGSDMSGLGGAGLAPHSRLSQGPKQLAGIDARPTGDLDALPTGTLPGGAEQRPAAPGLDAQPFPADPPDFRLIHIANGRALIADREGIWLVQMGSRLPDNSRVASIEQRNGRWVLVTSGERVIAVDE
jgi:hypothetical protein